MLVRRRRRRRRSLFRIELEEEAAFVWNLKRFPMRWDKDQHAVELCEH